MFSSPGARSDCGQEPSALVPLSPSGEWQPRHLSSSQDSWIHLLNPHTSENTTSKQLNTTLQLGSQALLLQLPGADLVWTSQVLHGFHGEVDLQLSGWGTTMTTDISAGAH